MNEKTWRCGSLTYTKPALVMLFFWLLWGDFCYVLTEAVVPSVMPLKFKALGASNTLMALVMATIPGALGAVLNPVISFRSDRFRGKWGRRIPFLLFTLPGLVACLVILAFADQIGLGLRDLLLTAGGGAISPNHAILATLGVSLILFTFFNAFTTSVFWYLLNDVVPEKLLARFLSWFRIISLGTSSLYNFFVLKHAETHYAEILIGGAIVYAIGFTLLCLNVKEGEYPPPPENVDHKPGLLSAVKTYARECHVHRLYWYQFLGAFSGSFGTCLGLVGGTGGFMLFYYKSRGLDLAQIGQLVAIYNIVVAVLVLGTGWLADRFHPIRVVAAGVAWNVVVLLAGTVWIFWNPAPEVAYWGWATLMLGLAAPNAAMAAMSDPPLLMRVMPRSRFGQFCSANNLWRTVGGLVGAVAGGGFLDVMKRFVDEEHTYCYIPVWQIVFTVPTVVLFYKFFKTWKKCGGDTDYEAPLTKADKVAVGGR
ncbi:MAG: MFS transporter [Verrucomicrobiales bacterium]|nr:MFS transporter [Verrucomicrobiales bacterium]